MQIRALQAQILTLKLLQLYIIVLMVISEQLPCLVPLLLIVRINLRVIPKGTRVTNDRRRLCLQGEHFWGFQFLDS